MKERHPDFVGQLEEHGLTYIKVAGEEDDPSSFTGSSWKTTYKTEDKNVAEQMYVSVKRPHLYINECLGLLILK